MKSSHINVYRELLEAERTSLLRSIEAGRQADVMRESRLLWIVESALQGIAEGMFGRCLFCKREIPARLVADVPWSAYCPSCQKLAEAYVDPPYLQPASKNN